MYNNRPGKLFWPNLPRGVSKLTPWGSKFGHHDLISLTENYPLLYIKCETNEWVYRDWYRPIVPYLNIKVLQN